MKEIAIKEATMDQIKQSRIENGSEVCNTCGKDVSHPYRYQIREGIGFRTTEGCVSTAHNGRVFDAWHLRKETKTLQRSLYGTR